jgi:redox-sensitive bicupin YhaK (pirin superfamily)
MQERRIAYRTTGHRRGPITRLMSPGDLGERVKPFVFLDHFDFTGGSDGGPVHPHSGIATHTTLLEGALIYGDSTGASGTLPAGGVEWMRAGGGVWHGGSLPPDQRARGFQLWMALAPPLELAPAESRYVDAGDIPGDERARVLLGAHGALRSPIPYPAPVTYLHVHLAAGERWRYPPPADHDVAWLAISTGALVVDGARLGVELAVFAEGAAPITVEAIADTDFVIASAAKHPFPLVTGAYSVHTSRETLRAGEAGIRRVAATMALTPWVPLGYSSAAQASMY